MTTFRTRVTQAHLSWPPHCLFLHTQLLYPLISLLPGACLPPRERSPHVGRLICPPPCSLLQALLRGVARSQSMVPRGSGGSPSRLQALPQGGARDPLCFVLTKNWPFLHLVGKKITE